MATNSELKRDIEERLLSLLDRVIDWLKFAEAKNTSAVGLSSTALGVIVTFLVAGKTTIQPLAAVGLGVGAIVLMFSLMLAVASFMPSTDFDRMLLGKQQPPDPNDNLLFYGHLARYEARALARAVAEHYFEHSGDDAAPSKLAVDLAGQIVTNSRITVRKLALFRYSLLLFGFGVLVAAAAMALTAYLG